MGRPHQGRRPQRHRAPRVHPDPGHRRTPALWPSCRRHLLALHQRPRRHRVRAIPP